MQITLLLVMMILTAHVLMIAKDATIETAVLIGDIRMSILAGAQKFNDADDALTLEGSQARVMLWRIRRS